LLEKIGAENDTIPWSDGMTKLFHSSCVLGETQAIKAMLSSKFRLNAQAFTPEKAFMDAFKKYYKYQQGIEVNISEDGRHGKTDRESIRKMAERCLEPLGIEYGLREAVGGGIKGFLGIEEVKPETDQETIHCPNDRIGVFKGYSDFTKYDYSMTEEELDI
jgi:hypothetical protein